MNASSRVRLRLLPVDGVMRGGRCDTLQRGNVLAISGRDAYSHATVDSRLPGINLDLLRGAGGRSISSLYPWNRLLARLERRACMLQCVWEKTETDSATANPSRQLTAAALPEATPAARYAAFRQHDAGVFARRQPSSIVRSASTQVFAAEDSRAALRRPHASTTSMGDASVGYPLSRGNLASMAPSGDAILMAGSAAQVDDTALQPPTAPTTPAATHKSPSQRAHQRQQLTAAASHGARLAATLLQPAPGSGYVTQTQYRRIGSVDRVTVVLPVAVQRGDGVEEAKTSGAPPSPATTNKPPHQAGSSNPYMQSDMPASDHTGFMSFFELVGLAASSPLLRFGAADAPAAQRGVLEGALRVAVAPDVLAGAASSLVAGGAKTPKRSATLVTVGGVASPVMHTQHAAAATSVATAVSPVVAASGKPGSDVALSAPGQGPPISNRLDARRTTGGIVRRAAGAGSPLAVRSPPVAARVAVHGAGLTQGIDRLGASNFNSPTAAGSSPAPMTPLTPLRGVSAATPGSPVFGIGSLLDDDAERLMAGARTSGALTALTAAALPSAVPGAAPTRRPATRSDVSGGLSARDVQQQQHGMEQPAAAFGGPLFASIQTSRVPPVAAATAGAAPTTGGSRPNTASRPISSRTPQFTASQQSTLVSAAAASAATVSPLAGASTAAVSPAAPSPTAAGDAFTLTGGAVTGKVPVGERSTTAGVSAPASPAADPQPSVQQRSPAHHKSTQGPVFSAGSPQWLSPAQLAQSPAQGTGVTHQLAVSAGTLINPFRRRPDDAERKTANRRRWLHLFPSDNASTRRATASMESLIHALVPNWKSLCEPAVMPLTTVYAPQPDELAASFAEDVYSLVLPRVQSRQVRGGSGSSSDHQGGAGADPLATLSSASDGLASVRTGDAPLSAGSVPRAPMAPYFAHQLPPFFPHQAAVVEEMVAQRLAQDFQLVVADNEEVADSAPAKDGSSAAASTSPASAYLRLDEAGPLASLSAATDAATGAVIVRSTDSNNGNTGASSSSSTTQSRFTLVYTLTMFHRIHRIEWDPLEGNVTVRVYIKRPAANAAAALTAPYTSATLAALSASPMAMLPATQAWPRGSAPATPAAEFGGQANASNVSIVAAGSAAPPSGLASRLRIGGLHNASDANMYLSPGAWAVGGGWLTGHHAGELNIGRNATVGGDAGAVVPSRGTSALLAPQQLPTTGAARSLADAGVLGLTAVPANIDEDDGLGSDVASAIAELACAYAPAFVDTDGCYRYRFLLWCAIRGRPVLAGRTFRLPMAAARALAVRPMPAALATGSGAASPAVTHQRTPGLHRVDSAAHALARAMYAPSSTALSASVDGSVGDNPPSPMIIDWRRQPSNANLAALAHARRGGGGAAGVVAATVAAKGAVGTRPYIARASRGMRSPTVGPAAHHNADSEGMHAMRLATLELSVGSPAATSAMNTLRSAAEQPFGSLSALSSPALNASAPRSIGASPMTSPPLSHIAIPGSTPSSSRLQGMAPSLVSNSHVLDNGAAHARLRPGEDEFRWNHLDRLLIGDVGDEALSESYRFKRVHFLLLPGAALARPTTTAGTATAVHSDVATSHATRNRGVSISAPRSSDNAVADASDAAVVVRFTKFWHDARRHIIPPCQSSTVASRIRGGNASAHPTVAEASGIDAGVAVFIGPPPPLGIMMSPGTFAPAMYDSAKDSHHGDAAHTSGGDHSSPRTLPMAARGDTETLVTGRVDTVTLSTAAHHADGGMHTASAAMSSASRGTPLTTVHVSHSAVFNPAHAFRVSLAWVAAPAAAVDTMAAALQRRARVNGFTLVPVPDCTRSWLPPQALLSPPPRGGGALIDAANFRSAVDASSLLPSWVAPASLTPRAFVADAAALTTFEASLLREFGFRLDHDGVETRGLPAASSRYRQYVHASCLAFLRVIVGPRLNISASHLTGSTVSSSASSASSRSHDAVDAGREDSVPVTAVVWFANHLPQARQQQSLSSALLAPWTAGLATGAVSDDGDDVAAVGARCLFAAVQRRVEELVRNPAKPV